jgi:hypothetical protein
MFVGKARGLLLSGAPEKGFTQVCSSLTCKYYTRLEKLARDKRSTLLQKFVTYDSKKFYNIGPRLPNRTRKFVLLKHFCSPQVDQLLTLQGLHCSGQRGYNKAGE